MGKKTGDAARLCGGVFVAATEVRATDAKTAGRIARAEEKLRSVLEKSYPAATLALLDTCASPPVTPTVTSLGSGVVRVVGEATNGVSRLGYRPLARVVDRKERRCALTAGDAAAQYLAALLRAMGSCLDRVNAGALAGDAQALCPGQGDGAAGTVAPATEPKTAGKIASAAAVLRSRVERACRSAGGTRPSA